MRNSRSNCRHFLIATILLWATSGWSIDLSPGHRDAYARCRALQQEGDWKGAREIARGLVDAFSQSEPSSHRLAFENELANLEQRLGNYGPALTGYENCLEMAQIVTGRESETVAMIQNNLAALLQILGDFSNAELFSRAALEIRTAIEGESGVGTVPARNNLAGLLWCIGDYAGAEKLYRQALEIRLQNAGPESTDTARTMENLGGLLFYRGQIEEAAPLAREAAAVFEVGSGPSHPDTLEALLFVGDIERASGRPQDALRLYRRVFEGRTASLGDHHVETAEARRRIADAEREMGDYRSALEDYRDSDQTYRAILPETHPDRQEGLYGIGLAALMLNDREGALVAANDCAALEFANFDAMLHFTDERQRLAYQDFFKAQHLFAQLGAAEELAHFLLRQKGVVLDSLIAESRLNRGSDTPDVVAARKALAAARAEYRAAFLGSQQSGKSLDDLEAEIRANRDALLVLLGDIDLSLTDLAPTPEALRGALTEEEIFLDYIRYRRYEGNSDFVERYAVVVTTSAETRFFDLSEAAPVDELIDVAIPFFGAANPGENGDSDAKRLMEELHHLLVAPLGGYGGEKAKWTISPTSRLSFVPFACLIGADGRFLIESNEIRYVSSGRELLEPKKEPAPQQGAVLVGNPQFEIGRTFPQSEPDRRGLLATFSASSLSVLSSGLAPLAGAESEVNLLGPVLSDRLATSATTLIGQEATEESLRRSIRNPRFLHLATHGLFLPSVLESVTAGGESTPGQPDEVVAFQNPMFGSCLALAGSSDTFKAWSQGTIPSPESDGILMANEAADLDLAGTEVVVLSACDTASGEATSGDGVLGLRRGFRLAGAENIISTLWPISDAATVGVMSDFYRALADAPPASSLALVQREWLSRIRDKPSISADDPIPAAGIYWAINLAGPFLLGR